MKSSIAIIISVIAIVVAVAAICITPPRTQPLSFDYQGVLVAILALLVTALLGWQIFSLIDLRGIDRRIRDVDCTQWLESEGMRVDIFLAMANLSIKDKRPIRRNSGLYYYIYFSIQALVSLSTSRDYDIRDTRISDIMRIVTVDQLYMSLEDKHALIEDYLRVRTPRKIKNHTKFIQWLTALPVKGRGI